MANFYLDINLSSIPKEHIRTAANGQKFIKAVINPRKSPDKDGYDHYIAVSVPKDQRDGNKMFIGRAQEKHFEDKPQAEPKKVNEETDLPF